MKNFAKEEERRRALHLRDTISAARHLEASQKAFKALREDVHDVHGYILSYSPFRSELEIFALNDLLAAKKQLILPRVNGEHLDLYLVEDLSVCLEVSPWGMFEPTPACCKKIDENEIILALIPGIAFDTKNYRLGYGKGFYDKLTPRLSEALTIGVGFREQQIERLSIDPWDLPLQKVLLF